MSKKILKLNHDYNAGFFSCCSVILDNIIIFYNINNKLPDSIDTSSMFQIYKINNNILYEEKIEMKYNIHYHLFYMIHRDNYYMNDNDISNLFFKENDIHFIYSKEIKINNLGDEAQFSNYKLLNFNEINPFIQKYFSPSLIIQKKIEYLKSKYNISNYLDYCGVFYRGNDKCLETNQPSYNDIITKAKELRTSEPNIKFIIQTDEYEFLQEFILNFPDAIYFKEIPIIPKIITSVAIQCSNDNINKEENILYYVSTIFIFSKLKNIIMTSGNGELFIALFRNNGDGIIQYLNRKKYIYGVKNDFYDRFQIDFWL